MKYFIDFEANSPSNEIIEIGCVSEFGDTFQTYVKPTTKIDGFITGLTGITNETIKNAPTIDIAILELYKWMLSTSKPGFLWKDITIYCYGNADYTFLEQSAKTCGNDHSYMIIAAIGMCLKDFTKKTNHFFKDAVSLVTAVNYFRSSENAWEQKHGALDDALALKEIHDVLPRNYSLPCSPFIVKTEMGIRRTKQGKTPIDYLTLQDAVTAAVEEIKQTATGTEVKENNVRGRIINAINRKTSYMGWKWKYVKIEKEGGESL